MPKDDDLIQIEIATWWSSNGSSLKAPSRDFVVDYFYRFFSPKFEDLTRIHLDKLLRELEDVGLVDLKLGSDNRVRGLKTKESLWRDIPSNENYEVPRDPSILE